MATEMTKEWLLERCKAQGLYRTPHLNDRLYLQCQAFCEIQNLGEYTGVKMLHLEENCLESLAGLQPLKELQCLYLRKNFVRSIDHLEGLEHLDTLDISQNYLTKLENLSRCFKLRVLVVSHNLLDSVASIVHLTACPSIMVLDLSHNKFKDGDGVLGVMKSLADLTVLYLTGNPFVALLQHYRKKLIGTLSKLNHLDDRPVFWDERRYAEAWMRGGQEEESMERDRVREIRAAEQTAQFEAMRQLRYQHMEERQFVAPLPMLQFTGEEIGDYDEPLSSPPEIEQTLSMKINIVDEPGSPLEKSRLRSTTPSEIRENLAEVYPPPAHEQCFPPSSEVEAKFTEHDSTLRQDQNGQSFMSNVGPDIEQLHLQTTQRTIEHGHIIHPGGGEGSMQLESVPAKENLQVSASSLEIEEHSTQHESIIQQVETGWSPGCPSLFKDLGAICSPVWKCGPELMNELPMEHIKCSSPEVELSEDVKQPFELINQQAVFSPTEDHGYNSLEWTTYNKNPDFCAQQYDDNFLLSLQGMNHMEQNYTPWTINSTFKNSTEHEHDPETIW